MGEGNLAQQLREHTAHAEEPCWFPEPRFGGPSTTDLLSSFGLHRYLLSPAHIMHTPTHAPTHTRNFKNRVFELWRLRQGVQRAGG